MSWSRNCPNCMAMWVNPFSLNFCFFPASTLCIAVDTSRGLTFTFVDPIYFHNKSTFTSRGLCWRKSLYAVPVIRLILMAEAPQFVQLVQVPQLVVVLFLRLLHFPSSRRTSKNLLQSTISPSQTWIASSSSCKQLFKLHFWTFEHLPGQRRRCFEPSCALQLICRWRLEKQ